MTYLEEVVDNWTSWDHNLYVIIRKILESFFKAGE